MINISGVLFLGIFFLTSYFIYKAYKANEWKNALYLILFLGFTIRFFVATDPYLHTWDERFHALVAKNLIDQPLKPTLYENAVLPYRTQDWVGNHVWLTKPTLPLWCMSVSMRLFGTSVYALRIPSLIISLLCVWMTFFIGKELFGMKQGLFAAFLHAIHGLTIELSGGIVSSDHVETFLLAFVQAGVICSIFYLKKPTSKYLFLIGSCMGLAFLSKWISGFMVLFIFWGFLLHRRSPFSEIVRAHIIIGISFLVIISPWISYIFIYYPVESQYVFQNFISPLQEGIENHSGSVFYYLDEIRILFSELIYIPLLWLVYSYIPKLKKTDLGFLFYWILIPLVLFSVAEMKRHTYILVASPAFFMLTAFFFRYMGLLKQRIKLPPILINIILLLLLALPVRYSIERIKPFKNRFENPLWLEELREFGTNLSLDPGKVILLNEPHYIEAMFHLDVIAYDYLPKPEQIKSLKQEGYRIFEKLDIGYKER